MSARLRDLANAPDGDVVIDPSMVLSPDRDTMLKYNSYTCYGSSSSGDWYYQDRLIFGFDVASLGSGKSIASASLYLYAVSSSIGSGISSRAYKVTNTWEQSTANWYEKDDSNWNTAGGDYDNKSPSIVLPNTGSSWFVYNITSPLASHYSSALNDVKYKGFLVKMEASTNKYIAVAMKEYASTGLRPKLGRRRGMAETPCPVRFACWIPLSDAWKRGDWMLGARIGIPPLGFGVEVKQGIKRGKANMPIFYSPE